MSCSREKPALPASGPTITDATGTAVPLNPPPTRIISLAPSITQNIYTLGAGDKLIGVTTYCKLPQGENKARIGNVWEQDIEKVLQLKPDLILATKEINQSEPVNKLRSYGLRVFAFPEVKTWEDIKNEFALTGKFLGKEEIVQQLLKEYELKLKSIEIQKLSTSSEQPTVFIQQSEQFHTVGKDTFIDAAINYAGTLNVAWNTIGRWPMLSIEEIIKQDPDLILISTMGEATAQALENWKRYPSLKAVKNNKIIVIDADICCQATPDSFIKLVEIISENIK
ncbi:MAG: ABC transporter substrate-binding protein [Planctomycetes bacterium]|nr:ABC transporter substrate-binding protein [Planctomycetota bacterium]